MKKIIQLMIIAIMFFALPSFKIVDEPKKAAPGTYQFVIKDTKIEYKYADEVFILIESKRKEHEEVKISLNNFVDVIIPSRDVITAPNFKPMAEFFYVN